MRRVTATDARAGWFRLLDDIAGGDVVVVERGGVRIVLRREAGPTSAAPAIPNYRGLIEIPELERANEWGWRWHEDGGLAPRRSPGLPATSPGHYLRCRSSRLPS